jgi:hypothetical protein
LRERREFLFESVVDAPEAALLAATGSRLLVEQRVRSLRFHFIT